MARICIVGISGKLGQYMTQHALDLGYEVTGVCRPKSVGKLARFGDRITVHPGRTDDRAVIAKAVKGCDAVLTVLVPWGRTHYSSGTAQAVMDHAEPGARLVFSCGWHISRDGKDVLPWQIRAIVGIVGPIVKALGLAEIDDQDRACNLIFGSDTRWTVVRGCDLEEGPSEGLPVWAEHVGDPLLASNLVRRTDFALFMVRAITDDSLIHTAPAIVGCKAASVQKTRGSTLTTTP
jgi:hypothetical protein